MPNPLKNTPEPQEKTVALSLTQAAKAAKISKSTLSVALQKGRLSAVHLPDGSYQIEPAELFRVFPPKPETTQAEPGVRAASESPLNPTEPTSPNMAVLRTELARVEALLQREREALQREQDRVADLQRRLDEATEERRLAEERNHVLTLRLTPPERPQDRSVAVESPAPAPEKPQEPDRSQEEAESLQKRLEWAEARMLVAQRALERVQERSVEVSRPETPARGLTGLLGRLLGRQRGAQP